MSTVARQPERPRGVALLPRDLTAEDLAAAPVIGSLSELVIEELTDEEFEAFEHALAE